MRKKKMLPWLVCGLLWVYSQTMHAQPIATPILFKDIFQTPVGDRGLEFTDKALALQGAEIQISGFVIKEKNPVNLKRLILSSTPGVLGDADEAVADDIPMNAVFVHFGSTEAMKIFISENGDSQISIQGKLDLGYRLEHDNRISYVRVLANH